MGSSRFCTAFRSNGEGQSLPLRGEGGSPRSPARGETDEVSAPRFVQRLERTGLPPHAPPQGEGNADRAFTPESFVMIRIFPHQYESCVYYCIKPIGTIFFVCAGAGGALRAARATHLLLLLLPSRSALLCSALFCSVLLSSVLFSLRSGFVPDTVWFQITGKNVAF